MVKESEGEASVTLSCFREKARDRDVALFADGSWFPLFEARVTSLLLLLCISDCYHIVLLCAILLVEYKMYVLT